MKDGVLGKWSLNEYPSVDPSQLHGIEINPYAHELASATIWIGYIQWLRDNGFGFPPEPILRKLATIENRDAILKCDSEGNPIDAEWPATDVIIGNPPFLGDKRMKRELGSAYVKHLRANYDGRVPGGADFVCYWFEKARAEVSTRDARAGLIATNSIRTGRNREVLERISQSCSIFVAWSDREWALEGAAVRVSIVGFDKGHEDTFQLDGQPVQRINSNLTSHADLARAIELKENDNLAFLGIMKAGAFDIDASTAETLLSKSGNPNGRPNADVVKPRINGKDIVGRSREGYLIDFNEMSEDEACQYEAPFEYVRTHVKPSRDTNKDQRMRTYWWRHGRSRPALRSALIGLKRCIVTPEVSKHRIFVWMPTSTIPDHRLHVFPRDDDYFFGVLHSRSHELWALAVGSTLEDRPCYNSGRIIGIFPFPWPPGTEPLESHTVQAIAEAARDFDEKRNRWLHPEGATEQELKNRTLTNLYNERPTWLDLAHKKLDEAVFDSYGWPHDIGDEEILERLLALNLERAGKQESG